jgi:hypothetical protein
MFLEINFENDKQELVTALINTDYISAVEPSAGKDVTTGADLTGTKIAFANGTAFLIKEDYEKLKGRILQSSVGNIET